MDVIGTLQAFDPGTMSKLVYLKINANKNGISTIIPLAKFVIVFPTISCYAYSNNADGGVAATTPMLVTPSSSIEIWQHYIGDSTYNIHVYFNGNGTSLMATSSKVGEIPIAYCPA